MVGDRAGICSQSRRFSSFGAPKGVATGSRGGLSGKRLFLGSQSRPVKLAPRAAASAEVAVSQQGGQGGLTRKQVRRSGVGNADGKGVKRLRRRLVIATDESIAVASGLDVVVDTVDPDGRGGCDLAVCADFRRRSEQQRVGTGPKRWRRPLPCRRWRDLERGELLLDLGLHSGCEEAADCGGSVVQNGGASSSSAPSNALKGTTQLSTTLLGTSREASAAHGDPSQLGGHLPRRHEWAHHGSLRRSDRDPAGAGHLRRAGQHQHAAQPPVVAFHHAVVELDDHAESAVCLIRGEINAVARGGFSSR
eukprot:scaffold613_cov243-Pinguiococcus_pyrenoidosus.AAC.1